jgi:PKD repeat protein
VYRSVDRNGLISEGIVARRTVALAITLATIIAALSVAPAAATDPPIPSSMAAVGDSITQAASTVAIGADSPQNSWSTGTNANVNSHYLRLLALNPAINGRNANHSVSGAKMFDLAGQMAAAGAGQPEYLTVLIGGNDVCTSTEEGMTEVDAFRDQFVAAMIALRAASPSTQVYVVSIPRVMGLYELFKDNGWARFIWSIGNVCQSLLARPTSTDQADIDRRVRVAQRNVDFNAVLAEVCAAYQPCRTDAGAAYNTAFAASDVSGDYFHPSAAGQRKLAAVSWSAGYWPNAVPPPPPNQPPTAAFGFTCTGLTCSFTDQSTDPDGTIASRAWQFGVGGATSSLTNPTQTFGAAATYAVTLTVTDNGGAQATTVRDVTVTQPVAQQTRVGALTSTTSRSGSSWRTTVTITIVRTDGPVVSGARVSATWTRGSSDTCTTGSTGRCTVTSDWLSRSSVPSVTMTVANVTHATLGWDSAGSVKQITVNRPT